MGLTYDVRSKYTKGPCGMPSVFGCGVCALASCFPVTGPTALMHDRKDTDTVRDLPIHHAEGEPSTDISSIRSFEDGGDFRILQDEIEDAFDFLQEISTQARCPFLVECDCLR